MLDVSPTKCLALVADQSLKGLKVATALGAIQKPRPLPDAIVIDHPTRPTCRKRVHREFSGRGSATNA
jgi:hypothetical protein